MLEPLLGDLQGPEDQGAVQLRQRDRAMPAVPPLYASLCPGVELVSTPAQNSLKVGLAVGREAMR